MAEYTIDKFTYNGNTYNLQDSVSDPSVTVTAVEPITGDYVLWIDPTGNGLPAAAGVSF